MLAFILGTAPACEGLSNVDALLEGLIATEAAVRRGDPEGRHADFGAN